MSLRDRHWAAAVLDAARRRLGAWLASGLFSTWIAALLAVGVGLVLTALVDRVSDLSGLRNGFFLLGAFLGLSGIVLVGARLAAAVLRQHGPLAQAMHKAQLNASKLRSQSSASRSTAGEGVDHRSRENGSAGAE